jgi:hypothetical protein
VGETPRFGELLSRYLRIVEGYSTPEVRDALRRDSSITAFWKQADLV